MFVVDRVLQIMASTIYVTLLRVKRWRCQKKCRSEAVVYFSFILFLCVFVHSIRTLCKDATALHFLWQSELRWLTYEIIDFVLDLVHNLVFLYHKNISHFHFISIEITIRHLLILHFFFCRISLDFLGNLVVSSQILIPLLQRYKIQVVRFSSVSQRKNKPHLSTLGITSRTIMMLSLLYSTGKSLSNTVIILYISLLFPGSEGHCWQFVW